MKEGVDVMTLAAGTESIRVEKDVEPPKVTRGRGRPPKYPFAQCSEVGDSFVVEGKPPRKMSSSLAYWNKKLAPIHFKSTNVEEGTRIWRDV